jgi:hypothetical protein
MAYNPADKFGGEGELMGKVQKVPTLCNKCKHYKPGASLVCAAYPDGIPELFATGEAEHTEPHEGDGGLQYKNWRAE